MLDSIPRYIRGGGNGVYGDSEWFNWLYAPVEQLENPIDKYASQVISSDGKALGAYAHSKDNRIYVNYEDLSPDLVKALIATEDIRFAEHSGIDAQGLFRAIVKRGILMQKAVVAVVPLPSN